MMLDYNKHKRRGRDVKVNQRQRKAIGTVLTLGSLIVWAGVGMWLYEIFLIDAPNWAHLIYFIVFGMLWIFPSIAIIRWMQAPDPENTNA